MRYVFMLCACFGLSCIGTSFAQSTVKPGNPKYWEDVCKEKCKEPTVIEMIEMGTGRKYTIKVVPISLSPLRGCECVREKEYVHEPVMPKTK